MKTLRIRVKPSSRTSALEPCDDGTWLARIQSPPVDGKANRELIGLVAQHFAVRRSQVSIKRGAAGRVKTVEIAEPE
jgi:uncharacterized protein (TIGR00251 family)